MWERVPYPVRTSLAAAYLLRQMADAYEIGSKGLVVAKRRLLAPGV